MKDAIENPKQDPARVVLPPASFAHEQEKVHKRWPAAVKFIKENKLNEFINDGSEDIGIAVQGGLYNIVIRALQLLGLSDVYGNTKVPLYVMNVTYPVIDDEIVEFAKGKRAFLLVEEGQPDYIEKPSMRFCDAQMLRQSCMERISCQLQVSTPPRSSPKAFLNS